MKSSLLSVCVLLAAVGCSGGCPETDSATGNAGGSGAGGSGGTGSQPECTVDTDCGPSFKDGDCSVARCKSGKCGVDNLSPGNMCGSPDPDGEVGPWPAEPGTFQCYGGACCFTCLVDNGSSQREIDPSDGPCVAGTSDDFCGLGGVLCNNCTIMGLVCKRGTCVDPDASLCAVSSDCPTSPLQCHMPQCSDGVCTTASAPDGSACLGNGGPSVCADGMCLSN